MSGIDRAMVVGTRFAGLSVSKTADQLGFSCTTTCIGNIVRRIGRITENIH